MVHINLRRANVAALALSLLLLVLCVAVTAVLASLPGRLDEFLLTNDEYCYMEDDGGVYGNINNRRGPSVQIDYGGYEHLPPIEQPTTRRRNRSELQKDAWDSLLWRLSLHLWDGPHKDDNSLQAASAACSIENAYELQRPNKYEGNSHDDVKNLPFGIDSSRRLHPICRGYRTLRTRLRFQQMVLPWNWHYRVAFRVKGLTLHSLAEEVAFVPREDDNTQTPSWWTTGWSFVTGRREDDAARVHAVPRDKSGAVEQFTATHGSASRLPPSVEVETVDVSFQSWTRPIISTHLNGITINAMLQKGEFALLRKRAQNGIEKLSNSSGLYLGAMPIQEAIQLLPKPPEMRGLFPRIGLMNITNVSLRVYENHVMKNGSSSVKQLLEMKIPNKFFRPITNLTLTHKHAGIDRKDFQPMLESSISDALRRHFLREAIAAFRNSWSQAHKFVEKTHEVYIDRWMSMGTQAWHQTQENVWHGVVNGTAPLVRAVEDWVEELKDILSEPGPPLAVIVSHYWNRTIEGMNKHGGIAIMDKSVWGHLHEMISNSHAKREKRMSNLDELKDAFDGFGQEIGQLVKNCEMEVKEIWLAWHRQFLPEL